MTGGYRRRRIYLLFSIALLRVAKYLSTFAGVLQSMCIDVRTPIKMIFVINTYEYVQVGI